MSNKTRSLLKGIAMLLVLLAVLMKLDVVVVPALQVYNFWIVVIAFALVVITSR